MARPKHDNPTPAELEILNLLWSEGPLTVRQVMDRLNRRRPRAYTSVMSLLNVMTDKGILARKPEGRAFLYSAALPASRHWVKWSPTCWAGHLAVPQPHW